MKNLVGGLVAGLVCLTQTGGGVSAQEPETAKPAPKGVMQQKLESCQKLLEALALNDLPKASEKAQDLIILSQKMLLLAGYYSIVCLNKKNHHIC